MRRGTQKNKGRTKEIKRGKTIGGAGKVCRLHDKANKSGEEGVFCEDLDFVFLLCL